MPKQNSDGPDGPKQILLTPRSTFDANAKAGDVVLDVGGKTGPTKKNIFVNANKKCLPNQVVGQESSAPKQFADNVIVTSKYTALNVVPLFLWEQFSRVANVYFLAVSVLEMNCFFRPVASAPFNISLTNGSSTNLPILAAVLLVELLTQLSEDRKKHVADSTANAKPTLVYDPTRKKMAACHWRDLKVGDIVEVRQGEEFPCDLLLLCGRTKKGGGCQQAYVETKSLDGETNLKLRVAPPDIYTIFQEEGRTTEAKGREAQFVPTLKTLDVLTGAILSCDDPRDNRTSKSIHSFLGNVNVSQIGRAVEHDNFPVNEKNILLRECRLKNTDMVYGLVINTGPDTKVMKSTTEAKPKVSDLDRTLNQVLLLFLAIMVALCLAGAIVAVVMNSTEHKFLMYVQKGTTAKPVEKVFFESFFLYFIGIAQMIPIALYVQLRLARMVQSKLIEWDENMVHVIPPQFSLSGEEEEILTKVRTADLNDELGQVGFIFSDKTGTLTQNIMDFRKMSVAGVAYGKGTTMIGIAALEKDGKFEEAAAQKVELEKQENRKDKVPYCSYFDDENQSAYAHMAPSSKNKAQKEKLEEFFRTLALCHSVEVEHRGNSLFYSSSSPDEQALVAGAKHFGFLYEDQKQGVHPTTKKKGAFRFVRRAPPGVFDKMPLAEALGPKTKCEKWQVLEVMEFTSKRKRMSVVVESQGKIKLLTKGADSVVFKCLKASEKKTKLFGQTKKDLLSFADDGLRTLAVAYRYIPRNEFVKWKKEFDAVLNDEEQQALKKKQVPNKIDDKMGELERELILLGSTAIEDKLQVGVPSAIADMAKAGVKLWVLTGDKEETAINIGFACQLLNTEMPRCVVRGVTTEAPHRMKTEEELKMELDQAFAALQKRIGDGDSRPQALVIDGSALEVALDNTKPADPIYQSLLRYSTLCKAVIGCRVSPLQKSLMVKLVKDNSPGIKTLAIGDGANDVPMIQQAHIGIGIAGQEGMQAVLASDYAIGQFRFMKRLTLVHGRENYRRASSLVNYMFYKNVLLCLVPYIYKIVNNTTEDGIMRWIGVSFFNITQTGMPIFFLACYDRMCNDTSALSFPRLYKPGPAKEYFNSKVFLRWLSEAMVHGALCYFIAVNCFAKTDMTTEVNGMIMAWFLATACNIRVGFEYVRVYTKTIIYPPNTIIAITLSMLAFPVLFLAFSMQYTFDFWVKDDGARFFGVAIETFGTPRVWLGFAFLCFTVALPLILAGGIKRRFMTSFLDMVNEYEQVEESGTSPERAKEMKEHLMSLDKKLWIEECGGEKEQVRRRKVSNMEESMRHASVMSDASSGKWDAYHTGANFGHDDETAALEASLHRKHIRIATSTDLSMFANKKAHKTSTKQRPGKGPELVRGRNSWA